MKYEGTFKQVVMDRWRNEEKKKTAIHILEEKEVKSSKICLLRYLKE